MAAENKTYVHSRTFKSDEGHELRLTLVSHDLGIPVMRLEMCHAEDQCDWPNRFNVYTVCSNGSTSEDDAEVFSKALDLQEVPDGLYKECILTGYYNGLNRDDFDENGMLKKPMERLKEVD